MTTTGELIPSGDETNSKPIDYIGNHTEREFIDMRRTAKSVRYSSNPVCRPMSTRRDWQADTATRSLVSERAAMARKIENENNETPLSSPIIKEVVNHPIMFDLPPPLLSPLATSLLADRATFRTLLISYVQANPNAAMFSDASFASIVCCLFTKSEDELCRRPVQTTQTSVSDETLFETECEEGLIRH